MEAIGLVRGMGFDFASGLVRGMGLFIFTAEPPLGAGHVGGTLREVEAICQGGPGA